MKKIIIHILFLFGIFPLAAQNQCEAILKEIEKNSLTLGVLQEQMETQKLANQTGIYIPNPEVEFHYLWGSPSAVGNRVDFSVTQSFDFPSVYTHKSKISNLENANAEQTYKSERIILLLSAKKICIELVYYNALAKEYVGRLKNAEVLAKTFKARLEKGDANIIEANKAQMSLIEVQNEVDKIEIERVMLLAELKRLNGGKDINFPDNLSFNTILPNSFDEWYASAETKNPILQQVRGQVDINQQQIKLSKAMGLPKFSAGYMSEMGADEQIQGVVVGVSIPLWENKNQVKQAKAQARTTEFLLEDAKVRFYNELQNLYRRASNLQRTTLRYKESLAAFSNETFLKKALDSGEMTLYQYLEEVKYYYSTTDKVLEAERDFELSAAELSAVEL